MTKLSDEEIEKLCAEATPGPWRRQPNDELDPAIRERAYRTGIDLEHVIAWDSARRVDCGHGRESRAILGPDLSPVVIEDPSEGEYARAVGRSEDAAFIAAARTLVPALLERARRAEHERESYRVSAEAWRAEQVKGDERIRLLEQEVAALTDDRARWQAASGAANLRIDELEAEVAALKAQLDDVKANFNERLKQALYDRASDRHDRLEELQDRVHDLEAERDRLRGALDGFAQEVESAERHFESRGAGGQQVPFLGDFVGVDRLPGVRGRLRWWARLFRAALEGKP